MASDEPLAPTTVSMMDMTPPPPGAGLPRRRSSTSPMLSRHGTYNLQRDWEPSRPIAARRVKLHSYVKDLFHTTVHQPWWRMLILVFLLYLVCWTFYATIGFLLFPNDCLSKRGVKDGLLFLDWMNWTIQTMSTIGYGQLMPACWASHMMLPVMVVNGFVLDACTFGFVFAKFASPASRSNTLLISSKVVGDVTKTSNGSSEMTMSLRIVNARKHPVSQPRIDVYLVDHRGLDLSPPEPPEFHELPVKLKPPLTFLEYPCTVTCTISESAAAAEGPAPTPLHDLLRGFAASGASSGSWPLSSQLQTLEALSLVAVFSAQEPAVGACFEVRRTFPLLGVEWGCCFESMLSTKTSRRSDDAGATSGPQTILDISRLSAVKPLPLGVETCVVAGLAG